MFRDDVFREHMHNKYDCKVFGGTMDCCRDEYSLLGESVYNYEDGVAIGRRWKGLYEIH